MRLIPRKRLATVQQISERLASKHDAKTACNVTVGIFAWVAAHAADEEERMGITPVTPYWRVLKARGEVNPKYPDGMENQRRRLAAEGHAVVAKGRRFFVEDYGSMLAAL